MGTNTIHKASLGALLLPLVLLLSGCVFHAEGQSDAIAISHSSDGVRIAICKDFDAARITISQRNASARTDWANVWEANGVITIAAGDTFLVGAPVDGATQVAGIPINWQPGWQMSVGVLSESAQHGFSAVFSALPNPLPPDGQWIQPSGFVTSGPCSDN